jgi:orotate phosphoribosyltransferase-like protein
MNKSVYTLLFDNRIGLEKSDIDLEDDLINAVLNSLKIKKKTSSGASHVVHYTTKELLYNPNLLESQTNNFLKKKGLLTTQKGKSSITDKNATIVIRINHSSNEPHRNTSVIGMCNLIHDIVKATENSIQHQFILVMNVLPSNGLRDLEELVSKYCKTERVLFFDREGRGLDGCRDMINVFNDHHKKTKYLSVKKNISTKLIRRVGHFLRAAEDGSTNYKCHKYFYEGQECIGDVEFFLKSLIRANGYRNVVYYCPESKWLKMAISGAIDTHLKDQNIKKVDIESNIDELMNISDKTLLVFDLIDTGHTYNLIIQKIKELNAKLKFDTVSMLITNDSKNSSIKRELLYHLVDVMQHPYEGQQENCPYCKLGILHDDKDLKNEVDNTYISTFNFWALAHDAGFGKEKHYPKLKRDPLKYVPDFKKMLIDNGAFLAYKTKALLTKKKIATLSDYIFLSTNEAGALSYAKTLQRMYNIHSIHISRKDIDRISLILKRSNAREKIKEQFVDAKWYEELTRAVAKKIIVFDEFCVSKTTFETLNQMLEFSGKEVVCFLPLVNFSSEREIDGKKVLSLYSIDLLLSKPKIKLKQKQRYARKRN